MEYTDKWSERAHRHEDINAEKTYAMFKELTAFAKKADVTVLVGNNYKQGHLPGYDRLVPDKSCTLRLQPMLEQFRFPRSKKKRIQKKWRSREENFRYPTPRVMVLGPREIKGAPEPTFVTPALITVRDARTGKIAFMDLHHNSPMYAAYVKASMQSKEDGKARDITFVRRENRLGFEISTRVVKERLCS